MSKLQTVLAELKAKIAEAEQVANEEGSYFSINKGSYTKMEYYSPKSWAEDHEVETDPTHEDFDQAEYNGSMRDWKDRTNNGWFSSSMDY